jgi:hypothetical protein
MSGEKGRPQLAWIKELAADPNCSQKPPVLCRLKQVADLDEG